MERKTPPGPTTPTAGGSAPMVDDFIIRQVSRAELLCGSGQTDDAIATLKEILKLNPDSTHAHMKLKDIYLRAGMKDQAAEVCMQLANIYESQGDAASAHDYMVRARFLSPATAAAPKPRAVQPVPNGKAAGPANGSPAPVRPPQPDAVTRPDTARLTGVPPQPSTPSRTVRPPREAWQPRRSSGPAVAVDTDSLLRTTDLEEVRRALLEDLKPADLPVSELDPETFDMPTIAGDLESLHSSSLAGGTHVTTIDEARTEVDLETAATTRPIITAPPARGRGMRWLYTTAAVLVLLSGSAVGGGYWFNSHLDKQYLALNKEYEAASAAAASAMAQSEILQDVVPEDIVFAAEPDEEQPKSEEDRAKFEEAQRMKREQLLAERRALERQPGAQITPVTQQPGAALAVSKPEPRKVGQLPPMTSQVPMIGEGAPIGDNRTAAVVTGADAGGIGAPPPPPPARTSRAVVPAEAISRVQPSFPRTALSARVSGTVAVQVQISEQGTVIDARAVSGPSMLWGAAVDAAKRWKFKPSTIGGVPSRASKTIVFNFKMDNR